jgi:hypothetical protein
LIRLVTGCSWVSVEAILEFRVSDTTLRARRDEWIDAGMFDALRAEALAAYDRIVGLDLSEVALDGSLHKAPCGGEGTGKSPVDRGKLGWKWSIATERHGIPIGWAIAGAQRNDLKLLGPTLDDVAGFGLLEEIETLHLDRGYDYPKVRRELVGFGLDDVCIQRRNAASATSPLPKTPLRLGQRWIVESANSWLSNYGQLRRNTDRHAQLCLVVALIIVAKLIDWRNRWSPDSRPIR